MRHYVYKTVNTLNGKYYIGIHSTANVNDGYMGSGTYLRNAIQKYGKENFKKEILYSFNSRQEAELQEELLVNITVLQDELCYNLIIGGKNGRATTPNKRLLHGKIEKYKTTTVYISTPKPPKPELFYPQNKDYEIIFDPNMKELGEYYTQVQLNETKIEKWRYNVSMIIIRGFKNQCSHLTDMYNNQYTNEQALKFINIYKKQGVFNLININYKSWAGGLKQAAERVALQTN